MTNRNTDYPDTRISLILQLKNDDDANAWCKFTEMYRPIIYRMACRRGFQDADAQDLAQQVLLSISQSIGLWEKNADESIRFRHWLRKIARNAILNALTRKPKDHAIGGTTLKNILESQPENEEQTLKELEQEHRREIFFQATERLKSEISADAWEIFQLSVISGKSPEEVSKIVNKSVAATYAARARAMKRMRQIVESLQSDL